jgi:hypothetical protein
MVPVAVESGVFEYECSGIAARSSRLIGASAAGAFA